MYYIVTLLIKMADYFSELLGFGEIPLGLPAIRLFPSLLRRPGLRFQKGLVLVSGDAGINAAGLISCILRAEGFKVLSNESGNDSLSCIISAVFLDAGFSGRLHSEVGVFAVSEDSLSELLSKTAPTVTVLFDCALRNAESWKRSVETMSAGAALLLDCSQEKFYDFPSIFKGQPFFFDADPESLKYTKLLGAENAKSVNAAVAVTSLFGVSKTKVFQDLRSVSAASGFGGAVEKYGVRYRTFLFRNSLGFNNNVDILLSGKLRAPTLLFILGSSTYESDDTSWLRNINSDKLREACDQKNIFVSGSCSLDMADRLRKAGVTIEKESVIPNIKMCLKRISALGFNHTITFLNYSALLEFRKVTLSRKA
jgi:hypothetical protein